MHMNFYKTTNPDDYGLYFYKQIGLNCTFEQPHEQIWTNPDVGTIHIYGSLDEIQCGTGDYTIPADLLAEFDYESAFLHFGIIYEGITYSLVNHRLSPMSHPSAFLAGPIAARISGSGKSNLMTSALTGCVLVMVSDLVGQYAFPSRYPVGVVTGILGAPYLIYLLIRMNRMEG